MASVRRIENELQMEKQVLEAGSKLADPPSCIDELLHLFNWIERCLSSVEQSPTESMKIALSPLLKAMTAPKLMKHSDENVRVVVASCFSQITRITAPHPPYEDHQMKEVFHLIVSALENIHDTSSRSYAKRVSILKILATIKSCIVMLDLNCDSLILQMFQHFFKEIREYHPEIILSSMEIIMNLVIEESDDSSWHLIAPILTSALEHNEGISPTARKLGERVLRASSTMHKLQLHQAKKSLENDGVCYHQESVLICPDGNSFATSEHKDQSKTATTIAEEPMQIPCETAMNVKHLTKPRDVAIYGERVLKLKFEVEVSKILVESAVYMFFFLVLGVLIAIFVK